MAELFANNTIKGLYAEHLKKEHDGSSWGSTGFRYSGETLRALIHGRTYLTTALDYGCGKGTLAEGFPGLEWSEYDPGVPGKQEKPHGQFDLVTCTDVMEHVEREYVEAVLKELGAYTKTVLFLDIACYPTGKIFMEGPYKGQDMHITIRDPDWWIDKVEENTGLKLLESIKRCKLSKGKFKDRVQMICERV